MTGRRRKKSAMKTLQPKILRNLCRCKKCNTFIESTHVHHWAQCKCGAIFTDGGKEYIRRGGDLDSIEDLTVYDKEKEEEFI